MVAIFKIIEAKQEQRIDNDLEFLLNKGKKSDKLKEYHHKTIECQKSQKLAHD